MNAQINRKVILIMLIIMLMLCIWVVMKPQVYEPRKELIDISVMGEEVPVKIITLNSYMTSNENYEIAYLLGDKGNLYVLCYDMEKFYVDLWHPEFWKDIEVVDICAERPWLYASALDKDGNVYVWEKEYLLGESGTEIEIETNKRENWKIQQLENIPKVTKIYATHDQFAIVTDEENVCMWSPKENDNPSMDDMEMIDMETPIINIAASEEAVFILDENHVLWRIENGTKKVLQENVKNIMQGGKGFVIQVMDDENEVYVHNIRLLQKGYETATFADKYEVSKVSFEGEISSLSVSDKTAVVCVDKENFYRWGRKERMHIATKWGYIASLDDKVYEQPVEVDIKEAKYYMLIGKDIVYVDDQNRMFVLIQSL